jgi:hypothetical protein
MNTRGLLRTLLLSALLVVDAGAIAGDRTAPNRELTKQDRDVATREASQGALEKSRGGAPASGSRPAPPRQIEPVAMQRGVARASDANTARLHSLLAAQVHAHSTKQPVQHSSGSTRVATRRGSPGELSEHQPMLPASRPAASPAASPKPLAGRSVIGGRHLGGAGMLGGPALIQAARTPRIDGSQFHPK